ncbi:AAA domain-containing protein [Trichoderma breve]|uniref:AAA domain-containing protein n=1 Tax=Trichoderma breve TaxID=2034170 RepID=A0A9W9E2E3_9HYPO|nr:AAA domain-containing protein [Trichoderma breve]KAJ4856218.1 AAA domain-containing protein [Trichoderma breve]
MITNWRMQDEDPVTSRANRRDYLAEARKLMNDFSADADVVAGTPVALMTMFNHIEPVSPSLFIVDEVGRLTEAMTFVTSAQHANTPTIHIGDTKQFGPMAVADQDKNYKALFTQQRKHSLMQRHEGAGLIDFVLAAKHRANGDVHEWARGYLYMSEIKTVYRRDAYSEQMHQWITDECGRSYSQKATLGLNMVLVDVQEGTEQKVGYSYTNPGNANFILALISRLAASAPLYPVQSFMEHPEADPSTYAWGKILVITGYKQKKILLEKKLSKLSSAEIPRGIVSVRTIDDSPSHQAEVVICHLARSNGPGFLSDLKRLAVMTTRAQGMTILVGQEAMFAVKNSAISELYNYLKSRDSIVKVSGWKVVYSHCLIP